RLFHTEDKHGPDFARVYEFDLTAVEPTLAGPRKPHERVPLGKMKETFMSNLPEILGEGIISDADDFSDCGFWADEGGSSEGIPESCACPAEPRINCCEIPMELSGENFSISDGSVVIAAITSCTNTSNPSVMLGAGLLAKKAVEKGLSSRPWVKTSMAPGSKVVTRYLEKSGLISSLEALGFNVVGYGCTTCIGNSGPLHPEIVNCIEENQLITAAVLSGNRNYEARINPHVRANYLASPILVVAYALAGRVVIDLMNEPIGDDTDGNPVYLKDLWPSGEEISAVVAGSLESGMFRSTYDHVFEGDENWDVIEVPEAGKYNWNPDSTYIQEPPFFLDMSHGPPVLSDIRGARVLAIFGDTLTTDHISPAGAIPPDSPAGQYLIGLGIEQEDFNSFGSRRGNHQVMIRGTFGNIRIRNLMVDRVGGWTLHRPSGDLLTIYDAAMRYHEEDTPLVVLGGKEYGAGSSRDWAAKGTSLLGAKAVIAESYERIHRSNLVGMGVLPLQFVDGQGTRTLGLDGSETLDISGIENLTPDGKVSVTAR
ncbi:MAG: aconitate hydratase AcnA, partial [bacterium]